MKVRISSQPKTWLVDTLTPGMNTPGDAPVAPTEQSGTRPACMRANSKCRLPELPKAVDYGKYGCMCIASPSQRIVHREGNVDCERAYLQQGAQNGPTNMRKDVKKRFDDGDVASDERGHCDRLRATLWAIVLTARFW